MTWGKKLAGFYCLFVAMGLLIISPSHAHWFIETVDDGCCPSIAVESSGISHISYLGAEGLKYAHNTTGSWQTQTLDSNGGIRSPSIALDSSENVHISYALFNGTTYFLKYTNNITGSWMTSETVLESPDGCWSVSMDIDSNDKMHIIYLEAPGVASGGDLIYVTNASGAWISETGPSAYDNASIAVDLGDRVHLSYYGIGDTQQGLFYLTKSPDGQWASPEFVFTVGGQLEGMFTSIAAVSVPHISFVGGAMEDNMYAKKKPGGTWFLGILDHGDFSSAGSSIALDPNGYVHVCYYHKATGDLRYQSSAYGSMGVNSSRTVDTGGHYNSLDVDLSGVAHIGYAASGKIKYATPAPDISVSPDSLTFGSVKVGTTSAPLEITVSNNGLANLIIDSIDITGLNPGEFSQTNDCSTIAYDESCTITVTFNPSAICMKSATLAISSNDPDQPTFELPLTGTGFVFDNWAKTYGGIEYDLAASIQKTSDSGYIAAGYTRSFGAGYYDGWILKLDASGCIQWQRAYGGNGLDSLNAVQQTADGGYIAAGHADSFGSDHVDAWILKLDAEGNIQWQKSYGGTGDDYSFSAQQTADGGYIMTGVTGSFGWAGDAWVLKLDAGGEIQWQKAYGGNSYDRATSIQQTADGGYIMGGYTSSFGKDNSDPWILKLDTEGIIQWQRTCGGTGPEGLYDLRQTAGGGYIVAVTTSSFGAGNADVWILKLDTGGNVQWQKIYGSLGNENAESIQQTADGGYIMAGSTDFTDSGYHDAWVLKLDATGNIMWQKTYGGMGDEETNAIQQTADGGYIAAGHAGSYLTYSTDFWVLKLDARGNISGCPQGFIGTLEGLSIEDTNATIEDTNDIPVNPFLSLQDSSASVEDTDVIPNDLCAGEDNDNDGVDDTEEMGPEGVDANYDGNDDGIPDSQQDNVASRHTHDGQHYVTLASPDGTQISSVSAVDNPSPGDAPQGQAFPYGFFHFMVTGLPVNGSTTVTLYLPSGENPTTYYKYGPTPGNNTPHWYEFLYDGQTGAEINGNMIALHFIDGQRGDHDLMANGIIVEPGAPSLFLTTPGDLDGDEDIDLVDAILALRVLAGIESSSTMHKGGDVNGNGKLGMEETIFILQTVSRVRVGNGP